MKDEEPDYSGMARAFDTLFVGLGTILLVLFLAKIIAQIVLAGGGL